MTTCLRGSLTSLGWPLVIIQVTRGTLLHCLLGARLGTSFVTGRQTFLLSRLVQSRSQMRSDEVRLSQSLRPHLVPHLRPRVDQPALV